MTQNPGTVLIVGASRGLGEAMAAEFLRRGWTVIGTVRKGAKNTSLHTHLTEFPDTLSIETLDVNEPDEIAELAGRLPAAELDMLFVNSGLGGGGASETMANVSMQDFVAVMTTNVLGVMRTVEGLQDLVRPGGAIGVMSSGQGSIANNDHGGHEVYRASKAALNQAMRSFASRAGGDRAVVMMAPGWIRTDLGGPGAPVGVEEAMPQVVDALLGAASRPGQHYVDRNGRTVPW